MIQSRPRNPAVGVVWAHGMGDTERGWMSMKDEIPYLKTKTGDVKAEGCP
jgi:hypothetical protein